MMTIIGLLLSAAPLAGFALKVAGWFGWGSGATASIPIVGPVVAFLLNLLEKLADFLFWALKGSVGYLAVKAAKGLDHIGKSVPAAALFACAVFLAWNFGSGDWRFWQRDLMQPRHAVTEAAPRSTPARRAARRSVVRETVDEVRSTIRSALGGAP